MEPRGLTGDHWKGKQLSDAELELKLEGLEDKYGKEVYREARKYAEIVFEENNSEVIEDIILKTRQYGREKMKKAFDIVTQKSIDNPKRSYGYVIGILEQIGVSIKEE